MSKTIITTAYQYKSAEDIYGTSILDAPEGYEFTGEFRKGEKGEYVLGHKTRQAVVKEKESSEATQPRFILRKLPEEKKVEKKNYYFKYKRTGVPKINEWYHNGLENSSNVAYYFSNGLVTGSYDIYERIEL